MKFDFYNPGVAACSRVNVPKILLGIVMTAQYIQNFQLIAFDKRHIHQGSEIVFYENNRIDQHVCSENGGKSKVNQYSYVSILHSGEAECRQHSQNPCNGDRHTDLIADIK